MIAQKGMGLIQPIVDERFSGSEPRPCSHAYLWMDRLLEQDNGRSLAKLIYTLISFFVFLSFHRWIYPRTLQTQWLLLLSFFL